MAAVTRLLFGAMAAIEQRGPSWRVKWRFNGRDQGVTLPTGPMAWKAKNLVDGRRNKISQDDVYSIILAIPPAPPKVDKGMTVREWATVWLNAKRNLTPFVRATYQGQLDREVLPAIGDMYLIEVDATHVSQIIGNLQGKKFKSSTITRYYSMIHGMFRYAADIGKIPRNPAARTDWIRDAIAHDDATDDDGHVYMTKPQVGRIIQCADDDAKPIIWTLANTGARWSETTAISVGAVKLCGTRQDKRPGIRIHRAWKNDGQGGRYLGATKGRCRRTVTMPPAIVDWLGPLVEGRDPDELLFHGPEGPLTTGGEPNELGYDWFLDNRWNWAIGRASRCEQHPPLRENGSPDRRKLSPSTCGCGQLLGVRPGFHDLRHSHVAWLIAAGKPLVAISRRIGHNSTTVTEKVYAGILPDLAADLADTLGDFDADL